MCQQSLSGGSVSPSPPGPRETIACVVKSACGWIFIVSACRKAAAPGETFAALRYGLSLLGGEYPAIYAPENPEIWLARGLIMAEAITGLGLLLSSRRCFLVLAAALASGFVAFIALLLSTDSPVGCGCGLPRVVARSQAGVVELTRAILLLVGSAVGLILAPPCTLGAQGRRQEDQPVTTSPAMEDSACEFREP